MAIFRNGQTRSKAGVVATSVGGGASFVLPFFDCADTGLKIFSPRPGGRITQLGYLLPQHNGVLRHDASDQRYGCTRLSILPTDIHYNERLNVEAHINSQVIGCEGQADDLTVSLRQRPHKELRRCCTSS